MGYEAKCFWDYQSKSKCYTYFHNIFNDIRYNLYKYKDNRFLDNNDEIHKSVKEIDDPILRHIALYLVENYCAAKIYFSKNGTWNNNYACESLNKWLDNKKSYFTLALHCKGNVHLWDKTIEPLWKMLEEESKKKNNKWCKNDQSEGKWCKRYEVYDKNGHRALGFRGHLKLPDELKTPICYKHVPKDYECVLPFPPTMANLVNTCKKGSVKEFYNKCKQHYVNDASNFTKMLSEAIAKKNSPFKFIDDFTFSRQMQKHCGKCPTFEYSILISVILSFFGTLFILFLLKKVIL